MDKILNITNFWSNNSNSVTNLANQEILKDHNEITRAYNGLAEMGKFAEDEGIDIKKHNKMLPERNKYDFSQSHTLLESGKVKHSWKFKKKNGKDH